MSEINCMNCAICAFKETLCDRCDEMKRLGSAEDVEEALISTERRWIPISEKLPELDEEVIATTAWNDITIAWRIGVKEWFIHEGETNAETDDIIAWMPRPKPYEIEQK